MRIAWITNYQAPYREPMWRELSRISDLHVHFLFPEERARHWRWRDAPGYRSSVLGTLEVPLPGRVARRLGEPMAVLRPGATRSLLKGVDALIVHEWWQLAYVWSALRARAGGVPYLLYSESTLQSRQFNVGPAAWLRSIVFRRAGAVVVPGPAAARAAVSDGTAPHRVVESVNSVDLEQFAQRVSALRAGHTPGSGHRFVYIGQLIDRKNVPALIRAFALTDPGSTLDIAGDGAQLEMLRGLARKCGVADRVRFLGFLAQPEIVRLLAETHTLVLPSTEEVYGFTALEAHVAGLQVVVSGRAGVAPNLTGTPGTWVVEPDEVELGAALRAAQGAWSGWNPEPNVNIASPRRAAEDIVRAIEVARTG